MSDTTPPVEYFYDGKGLVSEQEPHNYAKGKLTVVRSSISETRYKLFDNFGRLTEMEQRTPVGTELVNEATPRVSKYFYDFGGRLVKEEYPSGRVVENEFESDGDLQRIFGKANSTAAEQTYATGFSYTPDGRIQRLQLGNGLWESAKFNTRLQATEIALGHSNGDGSLWKLGYDYGEIDSNGNVDITKNTGNIARQTVNFNGLANPFVQTYKYDSLYRLTEARETSGTQTWKQVFTYDRYGNRLTHNKFIGSTQLTLDNKTHPTINAATNRFNINQGYSYDKNGNLIQDAEGRGFTFNGENKQTIVMQGSVKVGEYFYDGEGKRVKKKAYDSGGIMTEETVFVYSAGKLIAEYSTKPPPPNPTTSYTATDQLGSPRVITNSLGEVVSRRDFMPFGEELMPDGANRTTGLKYSYGDDIRQKFTGYQKDEETQLDFAEARMYENRHARFTAVDPLLASGKSANPQTFNRYVYVINNPLIYTDPTGLQVATHSGEVWTDGKRFERTEFEGSHVYNGAEYVEAVDGFTYSVTANGWHSIGLTKDVNENSARFADSLMRESAYASSMMPSSWVQELQFDSPGYSEASAGRAGLNNTLSIDGERSSQELFAPTDRQRAFAFTVMVAGGMGMLPGGTGAPPRIGTSRTSGSNFAEKLFHSNIFGKDSVLFGNKEFSQSNTSGLLNKPGNRFKIGWSGGPEEMNFTQPRFNNGGLNLKTFAASNPTFTGGGRQFRMTIGVNPSYPNRGNFHFYVPRTFVPNTVANPYKVP